MKHNLDESITIVGFKMPSPQAGKNVYNETYTLKTPDGMVVATATYLDKNTGSTTGNSRQSFGITTALGKFAKKTLMNIRYLEDGTRIISFV